MIDERFVGAQCHEIQKIAHEITTEGMYLYEQFQISFIFEKLLLGLKDLKKFLHHKINEIQSRM